MPLHVDDCITGGAAESMFTRTWNEFLKRPRMKKLQADAIMHVKRRLARQEAES